MPRQKSRIVVRHEYTAADTEDIEAGLKVWAAFIAERLRQSRGDRPGEMEEGRPA